VCRVVEIRIKDIFDIMPHITAIKYFPYQSLVEYFSQDKLDKIFGIIEFDMENILTQENEDIKFNIELINLNLNIDTEKLEGTNIFFTKYKN